MCCPDHIDPPPASLDELVDLMLLDMAASHPRLTEDQEAALKLRLFTIIASGQEACCEESVRLRLASTNRP